MKRIAAAVALAALHAAAPAQSSDWVFLVSGEVREYHAQRNSVVFSPSTVSFVVRSRQTNGDGITIFRVVTSREHCAARAGQVVFGSLDLSQERFRVDFAIGAGNVASSIAESLCAQLNFERESAPAAPVRVL